MEREKCNERERERRMWIERERLHNLEACMYSRSATISQDSSVRLRGVMTTTLD